ncbi:MAG: nucleotide exchange factor GrpE [Planctomycetes bacterium]|nr:nucleotide exchange factor GrpE [Planctomycetota bacterium]
MATDNENQPHQTGQASELANDEGKLRAERDDLLSQLQRARADYQNLRKRTQIDIDNSVRRSLEGLLQGLLLVVDNLDFALRTKAPGDEAKALTQGVEMTRAQFLHVLAQENVQPIPDSPDFDPNLHEAVSTAPSNEHAPGRVLQVLRRGWTWRGQVLRAAHVQVAVAPTTTSDSNAQS